jgi:putative tricarboxylic transport membrane protein
MTKRKTELLLLGLFLFIAMALYKSTASFPENVQGSTATYVRFLAVWFGGLSLLEFVMCLKNSGPDKGKKLAIAENPLKFWALLILMFVYAALLEPLGFYIASALFLPVTMVVLGTRSKLRIILTTACLLLFVYLIFALVLGVPLPESHLF